MQTECIAPGFSGISAFHSHCLVGMHEVNGRLSIDDWINGQRTAENINQRSKKHRSRSTPMSLDV